MREIRLLSLSEGLSFCVRLQDRHDPRFEDEMKRWLERAGREPGLNTEDAQLLAVSQSRDLGVASRRGQAFETGATARLALVAAAAVIAAGTGVMTARGDSALLVARSHPEMKVAHGPPAPPPYSRCPIPSRLRAAFVVAGRQTHLPLSLLVAVARTESHFDSSARSEAGAIGVLQVMPATARALGVDPSDPYANVVAGARYLRSLYSRFGSSQLALAAYNAGPTAVAASAGALDAGTRTYVANVKRNWRSLRGCR